MMNVDENILEIENLTKSFDHVPVLTGVSLTLGKARILGIAGENGAGKSTLVKCISGIHQAESGTIRLRGTSYTVPQEFTLIPTLKVYENIFLARELHHRFGLLDCRTMIARARELLARLKSSIDPERLVSTLSVAEKQNVELAKAFLKQSNLLIMDEPTTVLNKNESEVLFGIMRDFVSNGGSIIYISHKLEELRSICDEIAVLRDGVMVSCESAASLSSMDIAKRMVGRALERVFPPKIIPRPDAETVLRIDAFASPPLLKNVSFSLKKGEILGLAGLAGAGRTELAECICALRKRSAGSMYLNGMPLRLRRPADAFAHGIAYLPEDRQGTAILLNSDLVDNTTLSSLADYCRFGFVRNAAAERATEEYIESFRIKAASLHAKLRSLSGGNQQKVAIAKGLDTKPAVFIFDEPTRGVDVGARGEIYRFIHHLAETGVSCILISSDLEEVIGNCHRVLVMKDGELRGELSGDAVTEEEIMYLATGVK